MDGRDFAELLEVCTGSWLSLSHHGRASTVIAWPPQSRSRAVAGLVRTATRL